MPYAPNIQGSKVVLRGVEPSDIDLMYGVENDLRNWGVSGTTQPFSRYLFERFVESQSSDIYATRQLRLMVESHSPSAVVGIVDIFDFDPYNHRAGVGIIIFEEFRSAGYGVDALRTLEDFCRSSLPLHHLWSGVASNNTPSLSLFARAGYIQTGVKRDWIWHENGYTDEVIMQRIL